MEDDTTLLRRFAEQRLEADFAALVERHLGLVYGAALRRTNGDAHTAEDVTQEVFAELARHAHKLSAHPVLSGWLYVAAKRAAAKALRGAERRRKRETEAWAMHHEQSGGTDGINWVRLRAALDAAMDELPAVDRNAVLLRFFENRPFTEIGQTLRLSENTARMRVSRALERLELALERRGIRSTAGALGTFLSAEAGATVPAGLAQTVAGAALTATSAVGVGSLLVFMGSTKVVMGAAAVLVIGAIGTAVNEAGNLRAAQAELVQVQATEMRLARELAQSTGRTEVAGAEKAAAAAPVPAASAGAAAAPTVDAQTAYMAEELERLASDPELRELTRAMNRLQYARTYGRFFRQQGLSAEEIATFEAAKVELAERNMERIASAKAVGKSAYDPALESVADPEMMAALTKLAAVLGPQRNAALRQYENQMPARSEADSLAAALFDSDAPLTGPQGEQLTALIAANSRPGEVHGALGLPLVTDWSAVYSGAAGILSTSQLEMLQQVNERDRLAWEVSRRFVARLKPESTGASTTGSR
jgi:RNA polymerase sigma factor (sigma-70 family)